MEVIRLLQVWLAPGAIVSVENPRRRNTEDRPELETASTLRHDLCIKGAASPLQRVRPSILLSGQSSKLLSLKPVRV
jgi:hypothetical protein